MKGRVGYQNASHIFPTLVVPIIQKKGNTLSAGNECPPEKRILTEKTSQNVTKHGKSDFQTVFIELKKKADGPLRKDCSTLTSQVRQ